jgi:hypothetical protein
MLNRRGSAIVEYLMFIALVAAVAVPIIIDKFGDPLIKTFKNERSKFVAIIAQTPKGRRKPPVPAEWFSREPVPEIKTGEVGSGQNIETGGPIQTGEIKTGGQIQTGQIGTGESGSGSGIQSGNIQTGEGAGGAGRYSGAGSGGSGSMAGGEEFFSSPPKTPGGKIRGESGEEEGGGGTRRGGGGAIEGDTVSGREDSVSGGKRNAQDKSKSEGDGPRLGEGKKRSLVEAENELDQRQKSKKFDWWLIVKVLIVIFIVALIFLIVIGNSRK